MTDKSLIVQDQITIAVDADNCTPLTLELAVDIAAAVRGQLQGLFIENADLLNSASLPFAREVLLTSGTPRSLNRKLIEENYRRQAAEFRNMLSQKARQSVVNYDFRSLPGRRRDVFSLHANAGYIIFERRAHSPSWSYRSPPRTRRLLVIGPHNSLRLKKALDLVSEKLTANAIEVYWLGNSSTEATKDSGHLKQKIMELKDEQKAEALINQNLDYILVSRSITPSLLNKLISEGQCPVIVVD